MDEDLFALCVPADWCLGWVVAYVDPDGTCWLFLEDCLNEGMYGEGWTVDPFFDACPELADWDSDPLPPC